MRGENFPDSETDGLPKRGADSPIHGPSNGSGASPSSSWTDDRIDEAIRAVWLAGQAEDAQQLQDDLRSRLRMQTFGRDQDATSRILPAHVSSDGLRHVPVRGSLRHNVVRLATGLLVAGVLGIVAWLGGEHRITDTMAGYTSIYSTAAGERATITLPDGSIVKLNVGSRLEVPSTFVVGARTVRLQGAAFFSVVPNSTKPFTVISGTTSTKVLGTQFVVRRYPGDSTTTVAVRDGKVAVESAIVVAEQQAVVYDGLAPKIEPISRGHFSFTENVLTLDGQRIKDAIPELNRWYNADIQLGDPSLTDRRVGGQFNAGSVNELRELLQMTLRVRVERSGRILTLYSR